MDLEERISVSHWGMQENPPEPTALEEEFLMSLPRGHAYIQPLEFPKVNRGELADVIA